MARFSAGSDPTVICHQHGEAERLEHWEIDDNEFFGYPNSRKEAIAMARIVDRVLRAGPFHGKTWPGRDGVPTYQRWAALPL